MWRKAGRSGMNGNCIEVADDCAGTDVAVRDSKLGDDSPVLRYSPDSWRVFTASLKEQTG